MPETDFSLKFLFITPASLLVTVLIMNPVNAVAAPTVCDCVNNPVTQGEKLYACQALLAPIPAEQLANQTIDCRQQMSAPAEGPDICFCVRTMNPTADEQAACNLLLQDAGSPVEINSIIQNCMNK